MKEKILKNGIAKKFFSAFLVLALVVTMLPVGTMTAKADDTPNVTWELTDFSGKVSVVNGATPTVKGIQLSGGGSNIQKIDGKSYFSITIGYSADSYIAFKDTFGRKIKKIIIYMADTQNDNLKFSPKNWTYKSDGKYFSYENSSSDDFVYLREPNNVGGSINVTKVEFYLNDTRLTPTADNFSYDNSTGLVSAQAGIDLGTVTTYYKVDSTWTATKPTAVGTYNVGVVTEGSTTYKEVGTATEPFTASWTYVVKETPTAADFSYDNSTGLVSAQTGVDLGTVTTYYKVNGAWTATKPTAVGTYNVGVVTAGSDTYEAIGSATEPFTASWTYEVKASGSGTDASGSNTKDTSGKVTIITDKQAGNFEAGGLKNTADELKNSVLTDADKKAIEAGKNVNVWVELKDQTSTVSDTDKTAVADKLPANYAVGTYLDINLWKMVGDNPALKVAEIANGNVKIGFTIPENLQKSGRTYKMIRIHDGEATVLDASVDEKYELTFETDRFSTYALVYTDSAAATGSDTKANATTGSDVKANTATSTTTASPKTGDASNVALYLVILVAGIAGCAGITFRRKRQ